MTIRTTLSFRAAWRFGVPHRAGQLVEVDGVGAVRWRGQLLGYVDRPQDVRSPGGVPLRARRPPVVIRWPEVEACSWGSDRYGAGGSRFELVHVMSRASLVTVGRGHLGVQMPAAGVAGLVRFEDFSLTVRRRGGLRHVALLDVALEVDSASFDADGGLQRGWRPISRAALPIPDGRCACAYPVARLGAADSVRLVIRGDPETMRGHRPKFSLQMAVRFEPGAATNCPPPFLEAT